MMITFSRCDHGDKNKAPSSHLEFLLFRKNDAQVMHSKRVWTQSERYVKSISLSLSNRAIVNSVRIVSSSGMR